MNITIHNKKTYKGPGEYIGRGSPLGNPFKIGPDGTRKEVIQKYTQWLREQLKKREFRYRTPASKEIYRLLKIGRDNKELRLICFCAPLPCHGDVIKHCLQFLDAGQDSSAL